MHILHVIDSLAIGGAERMLVDIANATSGHEYRISVCVTRSALDLGKDLNPEIPVIVLGRSRRFDYRATQTFAQFINNEQVQVLHVHGRSTFAFVCFAKIVMRVRCSVVLHDHYGGIERDQTVPLWFKFLAKKFISQYVGVHERLSQWAIAAGLPELRVQTIGNALDFQRLKKGSITSIRERYFVPIDTLIGVVICGIRFEKGIDQLIEAVSKVRSAQKFRILVIGRDNDHAYSQLCKKMILEKRLEGMIEFLGEIPDVASIIYGCDFGVIPSRSESGPLVLIEYLANALPIVSYDVGNVSSRAESLGVLGFVQPGDIDGFVMEMELLLSLSSEERNERGQRGKEIAEKYFEIREKLQEWYKVYQNAIMKSVPN